MQSPGERIEGNQASGVNQLLILGQFPFWGFKHMPPAKQAHPATENYPGISSQLLGQVRVVKPYYPDVACFITDDSFSAQSTAQPDLISLPHIGDNGLLFALSKLRDRFPLAVVKVAVGEEIKQVSNCLHSQLIKFSRQA